MSCTTVTAQLRAFPGAEGFGAYATGGGGGIVYHVTHTRPDRTDGSLWKGLETPGRRTIVFDLGGTFEAPVNEYAHYFVKNGELTLAGQTAPPDSGGVTIKGGTVYFLGDDVIVRHVRFRPGVPVKALPWPEEEAREKGTSAVVFRGKNAIIDHCSVSWHTDEGISAWWDSNFVTVQNCLIAESLDDGHGILMGPYPNAFVTIHHNLMIHCRARNMQLAGGPASNGRVHTYDVVNNVVYNWREWTNIGSVNTPDTVYKVNWVGNYHQKGPSTRDDLQSLAFQVKNGKKVQIYEKGNVVNGHDPGHPNGDVYLERVPVTWLDEPVRIDPKYQVRVEDPVPAMQKALENAGATAPCRDTLDQRYIEDMRRGKGEVLDAPGATVMDSRDLNGHRGYPSLPSGTPRLDTDRDGMPDQWERHNGFDPNAPDNNGDKDGDGYTNLEEYLHWLADGGMQ